ncbi:MULTISPECIES: MFS transporter [Streptomyces]|uniref:MFS transporter n=1 Tax=Streptomyces dengpaensis TaxID=2049881 RepID=A0ABM6SMH0_9ACTN|nr:MULTISPECIES: MFS transporter [Streptomyces]AVH55657.1 MFS transporter [Streptomyces dengpaensis]PIB11917.1 MFS transporter [Streptomyces sp. HG99]
MNQTAGPELARSRRLLTGYFAGLGVVMAVWGARMPAVQNTAEVSTAGLALVLLAAALGMVAGLQTGGRLAHPARLPALLTGGAIALAVCLAVLGVCRSLESLLVAAFVFGAAHGVLDVAVNAAAVRCQNAHGRPIMGRLHASFSLGGLAGAVLASATAHTPHTVLFAGVAAIAATAAGAATRLTCCLASPGLEPVHNRVAPGLDERGSLSRPRLWLLGALAAGTLLGEGAAADWAAVHLHDLGATAATSAVAYGVYSAAMAAGRLAGDRLTARFGAPAVVRAGAALAALGLATGLAGSTIAFALLGWAAFGLGLSVTIPSLITAAGIGGPRAVATVAVTGYVGLLAGPALIGALATVTALPHALLLPALLAAAVAALAPKALEKPTP